MKCEQMNQLIISEEKYDFKKRRSSTTDGVTG